MSDKELVSSSVLSQHPDTSSAADGIIHSVTGVGSGSGGGDGSGSEVAGRGGGSGGGRDDLPMAAKRVLFVLASSSAALLVLAVSVGVVCRVQCKMRRSEDSCAPPDGSGVIAGVRNGRGPSESLSTMGLLRLNQERHSFNRWMAKAKFYSQFQKKSYKVPVCRFHILRSHPILACRRKKRE